MDIAQFKKTIIETCIQQCKVSTLLLTIVVLFLIVDIIYYCITKNNNGISLLNLLGSDTAFKKRFKTKEQILLKIVAIVALLVLIGWTIIPAYRDISKQQCINVLGKCTYEKSNPKKLLSNGRIRIETEGEIFFLELPSNWNTNEFSTETAYGEICYSKESMILLSFDPQS